METSIFITNLWELCNFLRPLRINNNNNNNKMYLKFSTFESHLVASLLKLRILPLSTVAHFLCKGSLNIFVFVGQDTKFRILCKYLCYQTENNSQIFTNALKLIIIMKYDFLVIQVCLWEGWKFGGEDYISLTWGSTDCHQNSLQMFIC